MKLACHAHQVMQPIYQFSLSRLGHVFENIQVLISGLRWVEVHWVNRSANLVAHGWARNAKDAIDDVIWLEDSPPPALEAFYDDSLSIIEWNLIPVSKKKKKKYIFVGAKYGPLNPTANTCNFKPTFSHSPPLLSLSLQWFLLQDLSSSAFWDIIVWYWRGGDFAIF